MDSGNDKLNCWEYMQCGREPGGPNDLELGPCPAATTEALDGVHGGKNAGRTCWAVAGTMCDDELQGSFARKLGSCFKCAFYVKVIKEESPYFLPMAVLASKLNH